MFLQLIYRIFIISLTLSILNNEKNIFNIKFVFNILSTSIIFFLSNLINKSLEDEYEKVKSIIGFNIMPTLIGPLIIAILYIIRHSCAKYLCIY